MALTAAPSPEPIAGDGPSPLLEPLLARRLRRYLHVLGCRPDRVDDLVQETLLIALRSGFRSHAPAADWAFAQRTAKHLFLQHITSLRRRREVELADEVFAVECGTDGGDGFVDTLRECVAALPERSRRLLEGTYGDGLGRAALARELGMRADGIKTALRRLRAGLRACIEKRRGEP